MEPEPDGVRDRQPHDLDLVLRVAVWGVAAGVVGARIYHVITSWSEIPDPKWQGVFEVWKGGLGVWGGIALGVLVGAWIVRRSGHSVRLFMDAVAPGLLLAQGIGRWGNWWNQELFGKPTDLPWGLEIDAENRPEQYLSEPTFHPTFLYEFIYDIDRRGGADLGRLALPPPAAGAVRALRLDLHVRAVLRGAAAGRPAHECSAAPAECVDVDRRLRLLDGVLRVVAVPAAEEGSSPSGAEVSGDGDSTRPRPAVPLASPAMVVRELELDLDAFEGPFDLLLTLVLKQELEPAEVDVAGDRPALPEQLAERDELDLEACGEFLVLVAALLELKARGLFDVEDEALDDLDAGGGRRGARAAARRVPADPRGRRLAGRAARRGGRALLQARAGSARAAPRPPARAAGSRPAADVLRLLAADPPAVSLSHMALRFPPVSEFLGRFRALLARRNRFDFDTEVQGLSRAEAAVAFLALLELRKAGEIAIEQATAFAPIRIARAHTPVAGGRRVDRPLRLITATPVDRLARTLESLLVVASQPLSVEELTAAANDDTERIETALGLLSERYSEGRSGIVLEKVAGGYAFRASRDSAEACARLFERPVERGLSAAALETLAIVAYLGPCTRPDVARLRGVAADWRCRRPGRARAPRGGGPRRRGGWRDPLPGHAALRARVQPRGSRGAAAAGRPGGRPRGPARPSRARRGAAFRLKRGGASIESHCVGQPPIRRGQTLSLRRSRPFRLGL